MTQDTRNKSLAAAWIAAILLIALFSRVGSQVGWMIATIIAFGPALTLMYFGRQLPQTITQRIRDARR
jgi:hypothetical protein